MSRSNQSDKRNKEGDQSCDLDSRSGMMNWELRTGQWEDVLADVQEVDAIIVDPPYSSRTHEGHDAGAELANRAGKGWERSNGGVDVFRARREISYSHWTEDDVRAFVQAWAPRNRGWFVCMSDSDLFQAWRRAFEDAGLTGFQPLPVLIPGMTVRMSGDGPSSWAFYVNVARPKALSKWGTLDGGFTGNQGEREHIGGKPLWLMRKLVLQYSKPGDVICDPCSGMGTTLLAAVQERRHAIGAEVNGTTATQAIARIKRDYTPGLFSTTQAVRTCSTCRGTFRIDGFAIDRSNVSGRQPQCRRCRSLWEHDVESSWKRFRSWMTKNEPASLDTWTPAKYRKMWDEAEGECTLCGAGLREWQTTGHNVDRLDNETPHIWSNSRIVCWPCNLYKSNASHLVTDPQIEALVVKHGRGRVPWQVYLEHRDIKRVELPDMEPYRADLERQQLSLLGGA